MSQLVKDENNQAAQCFRFPRSGTTTTITLTTANTSVASAALAAGVYRVVCSAGTNVVSALAPVAVATDMPMTANQVEYFYVNQGDAVAGISATAGATVVLTRMP